MLDVANIAALKALSSTVGTVVQVNGYHTSGDGGGGLFKAIPIEDFTSGAAVTAGATTASRTFSNVKWKYGIERQQPIFGHYADQLKFTGGAVWTKNNKWRGLISANNEFTGDAAIGVANGEKAYVVPKVEGWRVIPTYGGWSGDWIWERVIEDGTVTPEYFGAKASYTLGDYVTEGNDCTAAIQACMDSPFNVRFGGGAYYQSGTVYIKTRKTIVGVGAENTTQDWQFSRDPISESDKHWSCIWTDQNINLWSIQTNCHIEKFHFDVSKTTNGVYDKSILNYDLSFPHWGDSIWFCSFRGNKTTTTTTPGKGGIGIRFNFEDSDHTIARRDNTAHVPGFVTMFSSRKLSFLNLAVGSKLDSAKAGVANWANCLELDAMYIDCKIGADWRLGSMHKITGEYFQDGFCLPYEERDFPCFRLLCGTIVDIGIGDQRSSLPTVNDSVALGGSVTYPQNHFSGYCYETNGGVIYTGRSIRDYDRGASTLLGSPKYAIDNNPYINLDGQHGHLGWDRSSLNRFTEVSHWIDNGLLFADKKATVSINARRATPSFDFSAATDELVNTFPTSTGVTLTQLDGLWDIKDLKTPTISFGAGSDVDNDFVEITIKNPKANQNIINRIAELIIALRIGCKSVQVITRQSNGTVNSNLISNTVAASNSDKSLRFTLSSTFATDKLIIRFIGSTGVNTIFRALHSNSRILPDYPFLPTHGGTMQGPITFDPSVGLAPLTKRATINISSTDLLNGFSNGVKSVISKSWVNIKSVEVRVTSGTTNYKGSTMLDFFQGTSLCPMFTIDLSKLVRSGNRRMIQLNSDNEQFPSSGLSYRVRGGDPTDGNKAISVVIDYTDS